MFKKIAFCMFFVMSVFCSWAQAPGTRNVFYDALYLRKMVDTATKMKIKVQADNATLFKYYFKPTGTANLDTVILQNPFFDTSIYLPTGAGGAQAPLNLAVPGLLKPGGIGGIDVTNIVNGIADLMIQRAKQELTISFFDRFKRFAEDPRHPEFIILFPKTTDVLHNLLSYNYPQVLPTLRTAFFDDLKQITYHMEALMGSDKYKVLLANFPEIRVAVRSLKTFHKLEDSTMNAADVIYAFAHFPDWNDNSGTKKFKNVGSFVVLSGIISESLQDTSKNIWVPSKSIRDLVTDPVLTRIYMGLIYQRIQAANIKYYGDGVPEPIENIFAKQKGHILFFQAKISEFIGLATKVNDAFVKIRAGGTLTNDDYYNYINLSLDAIDYAFGIVRIFDDRFRTDDYLSVARKSNSLYKDIYSKQYTAAVNDGLEILTQVYELINNSTTTFAGKKDTLSKFIGFINDVRPYALFIANMADAKSSDDVNAALENVILPVGSSSIKKNTLCNISIQSYLGAFYAFGRDNTGNGIWSDRFGVTAPIGISWTPGFLSWGKAGCVSVFGSVFDLGAVVDYKLKKDPSPTGGDSVITKDYSVKLGQIFSPGGYLVYGSGGNLPLSFGIGGQYGPGLSKIDATNGATVRNPGWRWNVFLAVDLPFFNVVNKTRGKR